MTVGVVGAGYVGLTTAACLAHLGHRVVCFDVDRSKVDALRRGEVPIDEPDLDDLVRAGRIDFTTEPAALADAGEVVLCVPTPMGTHSGPDLGALESALTELSWVLAPGCVLAVKSTVPIGTTQRVPALLGREDVAAVSNPEFLREGHAVHDFLHPGRIVIGSSETQAGERVLALYDGIEAPLLHTDPASAEMAKYASNAFLAMRLSYVNVLAELCEKLDADVGAVTTAMGLDTRIGPDFLAPGPGWGGSCLPKDTRGLLRAAREAGVDFALLEAAIEVNSRQCTRVVEKVCRAVTGSPHSSLRGARIGLLGLTFKAGTGDLRSSPALRVAEELATRGAVLTGYDPAVPATRSDDVGAVQLVDDPVLVAKDAAALVVLTEWPEFRDLDWAKLAGHVDGTTVVDTRDLLDPAALSRHGFRKE